MTIEIRFDRLRVFRRLRRLEARLAYLETAARELREEVQALRTVPPGGARQAPDTGGQPGGVSVRQIMDEYLNFPDERSGEDDGGVSVRQVMDEYLNFPDERSGDGCNGGNNGTEVGA